MTATAEPSTELLEDPTEYLEPETYTLQAKLGLRPHHFQENGPHPDTQPCPSWCWIAKWGKDGHEIEWRHPLEATHTMEGTPQIAASLYPAEPGSQAYPTVVMATIEPRLQQVGQQPPTIRVAFRSYEGREQTYNDELLKLSIDDAEDLIAALSYLVKTAESA